jgi:hypothetical protein
MDLATREDLISWKNEIISAIGKLSANSAEVPKAAEPQPELISRDEVMTMLRIKAAGSLCRYVKRGQLKKHTIAGKSFYNLDEVTRLQKILKRN